MTEFEEYLGYKLYEEALEKENEDKEDNNDIRKNDK